MTEPARVTFKLGSLKRPTAASVISSAANQFDSSKTTDHDQPELVTGFDNGEIKSTRPTPVKEELVIPSQPNSHKFFKSKPIVEKPSQSNGETTASSLDDDAKRALLMEAKQMNEAWDQRNESGNVRVHTIEQESANSFINNLHKEEPVVEEKDVENADYDQVPIEDFGMAVLRGMGYKEDVGIGISNKKHVNITVPEIRPRGLGLGADRKVLEKINQLKRNLKKSGIDEKDDLCFEKGAFVLIQKGPHSDQYGTIEFIEEDTARLTVSLAICGTNKKKEIISISQYNVKLVTEKEFLKYSKYVNKTKAEQVEKETSNKLMKDYYEQDHKRHRSSARDDDDRKHHRSSKHDDYERKHHRSSHEHDRHEHSSKSRKH